MRTINKIIIHCSATLEVRAVTVQDIDRWHREKGNSVQPAWVDVTLKRNRINLLNKIAYERGII